MPADINRQSVDARSAESRRRLIDDVRRAHASGYSLREMAEAWRIKLSVVAEAFAASRTV
jgi:hypothetical protein